MKIAMDQSVTIMSTNIVDYVSLCEKNDDLIVLELLNKSYFPSIHSNVIRTNGIIDKAIADRQTVFWKSKNEINNANNACFSALNIIKDYETLASTNGIPDYIVTICITTGTCLVNNKDNTILGKICNLNAALLNKVYNYGIRILLDEQTKELVKKQYITREIDKIKTISGNVNIFELVSLNTNH